VIQYTVNQTDIRLEVDSGTTHIMESSVKIKKCYMHANMTHILGTCRQVNYMGDNFL